MAPQGPRAGHGAVFSVLSAGDEFSSGPVFPCYPPHPFPSKWEYLLFVIKCWKNVTGLLIFTVTGGEEMALSLKREFPFLNSMGAVNNYGE